MNKYASIFQRIIERIFVDSFKLELDREIFMYVGAEKSKILTKFSASKILTKYFIQYNLKDSR